MAKLQFLIAALLVNILAASSQGDSKQTINGNFNPLNLHFIGAIEGISYFAEANQTMTWYEAKAYCEATNMELATVKTATQSSGLNALMLEAYEGSGFWTAATEHRTIAALSWNGKSNEALLPNAFSYAYLGPAGNFYCGYIVGSIGTYLSIYQFLCSYELRVLCQTAN